MTAPHTSETPAGETGSESGAPPDRDPAPGLEESLREIGQTGKAALGSGRDSVRALRRLISADIALARSAFGRGLAWAGVAVVFGASAWLLITGALIALLQRMGWSWLESLSLAAAISILMALIAARRVSHYFDYTGMHATRRQLHRLGLFDEKDDDDEEGCR